MSDKTKLYLIIGAAVLALILILVAIIVHLSGGDATAVGGAGATGIAAVAAATAQRAIAKKTVEDTAAGLDEATDEMEANKDATNAAVAAVDDEVDNMNRDEKEKAGEDLFGGGE